MRRAVHDSFGPQAAELYQPMQTREARLTVLDLLSRPEHWQDVLRQYVPVWFQKRAGHGITSTHTG